MSKAQKVTVELGGEKREIPPLSAERGLEVAWMIVPHLVELRPQIEAFLASPPSSASEAESRQRNISVGLDIVQAALPLFEPQQFLHFGSLLTDIPQEELGKASVNEALDIIVTALLAVDLAGAIAAAARLMGALTSTLPVAEEQEVQGEAEV